MPGLIEPGSEMPIIQPHMRVSRASDEYFPSLNKPIETETDTLHGD